MANILFQWMLTGIVALLHPFFVSVIEINHNQKEATVEISVRVFAEDIEKTMQKYTSAKVDILNPPDKILLDKEISTYISQRLKLSVNGKPVTLKYIGHEIQKESVWSYFEVAKVPDLSKLEVDCSLLYDYEKNQTNILHVKSKGVDKSFKLDYPETKTLFAF